MLKNLFVTFISMLFSMIFFTSNAYAFPVACPSGFAPNVVCSCENGNLILTSGGSSTNDGPKDFCTVEIELQGENIREQLGLQGAIINAANRDFDDLRTINFGDNVFNSLFGSLNDPYKPSDLPEWDFSANVQSNIGESEISLNSAPDRKSDFHSVAVNLNANKDAFSIGGQFQYLSINGLGINNGQDTLHYGFMLVPAYQALKQAEHGINLDVFSFIDISANDNKNSDDQTRFATGAGFKVGRSTSLGLFNLGYTFTHDRNLDNDTELTGEQYFNIHQVSFDYSVQIIDSLLFTTRLSHMHLADLPNTVEDNGSKAGFGFSYIGFKNIVLKVGYDKSFDGYGHQSGNFSAAYRW